MKLRKLLFFVFSMFVISQTELIGDAAVTIKPEIIREADWYSSIQHLHPELTGDAAVIVKAMLRRFIYYFQGASFYDKNNIIFINRTAFKGDFDRPESDMEIYAYNRQQSLQMLHTIPVGWLPAQVSLSANGRFVAIQNNIEGIEVFEIRESRNGLECVRRNIILYKDIKFQQGAILDLTVSDNGRSVIVVSWQNHNQHEIWATTYELSN